MALGLALVLGATGLAALDYSYAPASVGRSVAPSSTYPDISYQRNVGADTTYHDI